MAVEALVLGGDDRPLENQRDRTQRNEPTAEAAVVIKGVSTTAGFKWKPHAVSVTKGTKVVWKAVTGTHTVTAWKGRWSKSTTIRQGTSTSFIFRRNGIYRFRCLFHSTLVSG